MATTIAQGFVELKSHLEITGLQKNTISQRRESVQAVLRSGLEVEDSFLTGSYSRNTMIAPLAEADVDIFFVLHPRFFHHYNGANGGPAGLLDLVKRTLLKTYTRTPDIGRNGQAVTVRFSDFIVDVAPGFRRQGGGFLIPNSITGKWLSTDPQTHVRLISEANVRHNGDLVPLVKMIKGWNRASGEYLRSFHLEVLTTAVLNNVRISDYPSGVRFVFDKARQMITQRILDPAGYGDDVGEYLNTQTKVQEAVTKLQTAYDRAVKAEDYARRGLVRDAFDLWRRIFGDYFPAYGQFSSKSHGGAFSVQIRSRDH
jgi:hypothetical protein